MDLNPYKFEAPWNAWEFAFHILHRRANLVVLSMAWLTREEARSFSRLPREPDMETLSYWLTRLEPLIRAETEDEIIVVIANRTGTEEEAVYAGTSVVLGMQAGEVKVYGILGRGEKELLVVDTSVPPTAKLVSERKPDNPTVQKSSVDSKHEAKAVDPPRLSASSDKSDVSQSSSVSLETDTTALTSPNPDDTYDPLHGQPTPISPVAPESHNTFFPSKDNDASLDKLHEALKSSIDRPEINPVRPDSPTFTRPKSPKSRNASRTGRPDTRTPDLMGHDFVQEQRIRQDLFEAISPTIPHSAPLLRDRLSPISSGLGPSRRMSITSPRPKSTVW
jgi:protein N-terminal amidase